MTHAVRRFLSWPLAAAVALLASGAVARAQTVVPQYSASYSLQILGSIPGLPTPYGGLRFVDANTILIGGAANSAPGRLYTIDVTRDAGGHITGFVGTAVVYGNVGENNDGGVTFGPGGVLFTTPYNQNEMGQTKPGSLDEDKVTLLTPLGIAGCAESGTALRLARRARAVRLHRARTARQTGGGAARAGRAGQACWRTTSVPAMGYFVAVATFFARGPVHVHPWIDQPAGPFFTTNVICASSRIATPFSLNA